MNETCDQEGWALPDYPISNLGARQETCVRLPGHPNRCKGPSGTLWSGHRYQDAHILTSKPEPVCSEGWCFVNENGGPCRADASLCPDPIP